MPLVNIMVNSRAYTVACDEGEEGHLKELAAHVDEKAREVLASVGQVGDARMLLMAALLIADEHNELAAKVAAGRRPQPPVPARSRACICAQNRLKAMPPMCWKALRSGWKTLPRASHTPKLGADGHCLVRQVAMPRGLNCTHRELSLTGTVVPDTRRPPALAGP